MLDWHLGMVETEDGRARALGAADALTLGRVWLAPVALASPTPLVCAAGFATDALDGPLARAAEPTRAGRDLEGLADACFATALWWACAGGRPSAGLLRPRSWPASAPAWATRWRSTSAGPRNLTPASPARLG